MKADDESSAVLGSKENPIRLYRSEIEALEKKLEQACFEYDHASTELEKESIRSRARAEIFARWPMLFDNCHIVERY